MLDPPGVSFPCLAQGYFRNMVARSEANATSALTAAELSHIRSTAFIIIIIIRQNHQSFFFNDPRAISSRLLRRPSTVRTRHLQSGGCVGCDQVQGGRVPLSRRGSRPRSKSPHLSPEAINIPSSSPLFGEVVDRNHQPTGSRFNAQNV